MMCSDLQEYYHVREEIDTNLNPIGKLEQEAYSRQEVGDYSDCTNSKPLQGERLHMCMKNTTNSYQDKH